MSSKQYPVSELQQDQHLTAVLQIPKTVMAILLVSLLIKILLLNLNRGEYTDGIIQLQLWDSSIVFFPPGYSALTWLVNWITGDLLTAGRVVSIVASTVTLGIFYLLALQVLKNEREAVWATLFLALSPIFNRWSLRVMTDSLFCATFVYCSLMVMECLGSRKRNVCWLVFATGLGVLVRYQALFFVPFIAYILYKNRRDNSSTLFSAKKAVAFAFSLVPWLVMAYWVWIRGFGHLQQFSERAALGFFPTLILYWNSFETYLLYAPWAVTYGLFLCSVAGAVRLWKGNCDEWRFVMFFAIASVCFLAAQSAFLSFQYRYLLPLVPLVCILASRGFFIILEAIPNVGLKPVWTGFVLTNLCIMTTAVLYLQKETFGDLAESAKYFSEKWTEARILSDETYGYHAANVKMKFWSGREILFLGDTEPQAGDIVILHNSYTPDLAAYHEQLNQKFETVQLNRWSTFSHPGEFTTIPLLPDIMVNPQIPLTSNPQCMAFRFTPQPYYSIAFLLKERPQ